MGEQAAPASVADGSAPQRVALNYATPLTLWQRFRPLLRIVLALFFIALGAGIGFVSQRPRFRAEGYVYFRFAPATPDHLGPTFAQFVSGEMEVLRRGSFAADVLASPAWKATAGAASTSAAEFASKLSVSNPRGGWVVVVSYDDENPATAKGAIDAIGQTYGRAIDFTWLIRETEEWQVARAKEAEAAARLRAEIAEDGIQDGKPVLAELLKQFGSMQAELAQAKAALAMVEPQVATRPAAVDLRQRVDFLTRASAEMQQAIAVWQKKVDRPERALEEYRRAQAAAKATDPGGLRPCVFTSSSVSPAPVHAHRVWAAGIGAGAGLLVAVLWLIAVRRLGWSRAY